MKKIYFNFSILLNWIFLVLLVFLLIKINISEAVSNKTYENDNIKEMEKNISSPHASNNKNDEFKKVSGAENLFKLPSPRMTSNVSLEETFKNRRSRRSYKDKPLTAKEISQMLWAAYGITKPKKSPSYLAGGLKTAPSAGARYPLEIYLVAGNVKGLSSGLYKYIPSGHSIIKVMDGDLRKDLLAGCWYQEMVGDAPISIVYTAVFSRITVKYGERGRSRYVCMEVGHSAQNVYLQAEALGLGTCAVGAFEDDEVTRVLKLPKEEEILYIMPVGHYK